ncbi:MAG: hypothetical protein HY092_00460 [Candidatus Kerfeldbacteria bacterium]|nr:hypothetical protein [Candidatus Kerfeldbacteria bacterium]
MEARDYIQLFWRQRWLVLVVVLVVSVTAYITAALRPVSYATSESFAVNRINKEITTSYQYDGYYALQAADLFSQTVVSWFSTPSVLQDFYHQANLDANIDSVNSLAGRFKVRKYSAQNIVVRFNESTHDRAAKLAAGIRQVVESRASSLNQTADGKSIFSVVGSDPVIAPSQPNRWLITAVAALISLYLALLIVTGRHYLRS